MSDYCDGCGEWDVPDGLTACAGCSAAFCPECIDEDGCCDECSDGGTGDE